ncbi:CPBP family intramembrane metalloprotease [Nostoc sp. FACHB-152]|uniref:CPBP family intramembrane glutamic endopeptidase n=1 Tax=unclassified Nostoc TaxID=2593658 RepID=UPI001689CCFC|nr:MULTISPECIES: CPBP family intramembrane glutamic endopeptidase [unclassified Nostoc]MBD2448063.1 CPBP family intramembrane metalloprotease [Nostoc sp. FACHB-152]MBD2466170.1 CPBP family intramembrane metalloprotease [Nostoc sp. FACHB-145]
MAILKQFGILFVLGSVGIVMFTIASIPLVEQQLAKLSPEILEKVPPLGILMLLQGLQYSILLAISILIGIGCAYRVGLSSHLIDHWVFHTAKSPSFAVEMKWSLGVGAAAAIVLLLLDQLMQPVLPEELRAANNTVPSWLNLLTAMFYGGITEEILMRWGLMSLLVWIAWKIFKQGITLPSQGIYQGAIVLAALVFGLLHLPATAAIVPLTPVVIIRALLLNGIGGIAFGWLFWQYSLEAAMLAHISFHAFASVLRGLLARLA